MMKLLPEWKIILRKAWSIRLMLFAGLLSGAEVVLPLFADAIPRGLFAGLSIFVICGAFVSRIVAQKNIP